MQVERDDKGYTIRFEKNDPLEGFYRAFLDGILDGYIQSKKHLESGSATDTRELLNENKPAKPQEWWDKNFNRFFEWPLLNK